MKNEFLHYSLQLENDNSSRLYQNYMIRERKQERYL
jgi:hypothetical protein